MQNDLSQLSGNGLPKGRTSWMLAVNPQTGPDVLSALVENGAASLLVRIAEHPRVSVETLCVLAKHDDPEVRSAVAENSLTPAHVLQTLANDDNADVRYMLAESPHTPLFILEALCEDGNPYVGSRASTTIRRVTLTQTTPREIAPYWSQAKQSFG